jgi:arylsulfatase A-like enzyme
MYKAENIPAWKNFADKYENKPYIQKQMKFNWGLENAKWEQWARYMQRYYAMISQVDDAVGLVLKTLDELNLTNNTVVIYTADHGDAAGSHGFIDKHYVMYDEEVHIPFIVRWPGIIKPGTVNQNFIMQELDMAATLPAIAGVAWKCQGANLLPLFKGENPTDWRKYAFSNYNGQQFGLFVQRMIRNNDYKYVWNMTDTDEFYDLNADPFEMKNQIKSPKYAAQIASMRKDLYEDLVKREDPLIRQQATKFQLINGKKVTL